MTCYFSIHFKNGYWLYLVDICPLSISSIIRQVNKDDQQVEKKLSKPGELIEKVSVNNLETTDFEHVADRSILAYLIQICFGCMFKLSEDFPLDYRSRGYINTENVQNFQVGYISKHY